MSEAKSLFLRPHGVLKCSQKSIKSMVPHLIFKIFSKRSSTRFLKDVLSKSTTFGSNVRPKLNPKSCRQLQTASFCEICATRTSKILMPIRRFAPGTRELHSKSDATNATTQAAPVSSDVKLTLRTPQHTLTHPEKQTSLLCQPLQTGPKNLGGGGASPRGRLQ